MLCIGVLVKLDEADFSGATSSLAFEEEDGLEGALDGGGLDAAVEEDGVEEAAVGTAFKLEDECLAFAFSLQSFSHNSNF